MIRMDPRVQKTKEALHQALLILLNEKELESISISELCRIADINRGTFYLHYSQVGDVFEEYFKEITIDLRNSYMEPYRYYTEINSVNIDPATIRIFHHIEKYKTFYKIVFNQKSQLNYYYLLFDEIKQLFANNNDIMQLLGSHQPLFSAYIANAIIGVILEWYKQDFEWSANEINHQFVELIKLNFNWNSE